MAKAPSINESADTKFEIPKPEEFLIIQTPIFDASFPNPLVRRRH
jgi:hypothetical protein